MPIQPLTEIPLDPLLASLPKADLHCHQEEGPRLARLLDQLVRSGVTIECSLSCNVILGAVSSYEDHPLRRFMAAGVPVTLNTDDPVRV